jgi:hypothetical protein
MRCLVVDSNPVFLYWMKRHFQYTPVSTERYPVVVAGSVPATFHALPAQCSACVVVPGEEEAQLRLVPCAETCGGRGAAQGTRYTLHCPAPTSGNTRQLVKAVLKRVEGLQVDVVVMPMMGNRPAATAQDMHAGYMDALVKK